MIRPAKLEDIDKLCTIHHTTWLNTYPNSDLDILFSDIEEKDFDSLGRKDKWRQRLNSPDLKVFVAEDNSRIVGFAEIRKNSTLNHLEAIYILPEFQGRGLGKTLLKQALEWPNNTLGTDLQVASYNDKAIAFYEKQGFIRCGDNLPPYLLPNGKKIPLLKMIKT